MVISGEGRIDQQSLRGKVVIGVARRAKKRGVPVVAIVGDIGDGVDSAYEEGVSAIFSINRKAIPFTEAKPRAKDDLRDTLDDLMRLISCVRRN
jgi:glycerate kinase